MRYSLYVLILCFSFGCSRKEPRKPINPRPSTTILNETKKIYNTLKEREELKIKKLIELDSTKNYIASKHGFWYTYLVKESSEKPMPKLGDVVKLTYNITDLEGNIIYSEKELGEKNYKVDKEDFISAIQKGIKLMKEGETITFVIPFYNAFGVSGDFNKIGINTSIKSTVTLIKLN